MSDLFTRLEAATRQAEEDIQKLQEFANELSKVVQAHREAFAHHAREWFHGDRVGADLWIVDRPVELSQCFASLAVIHDALFPEDPLTPLPMADKRTAEMTASDWDQANAAMPYVLALRDAVRLRQPLDRGDAAVFGVKDGGELLRRLRERLERVRADVSAAPADGPRDAAPASAAAAPDNIPLATRATAILHRAILDEKRLKAETVWRLLGISRPTLFRLLGEDNTVKTLWKKMRAASHGKPPKGRKTKDTPEVKGQIEAEAEPADDLADNERVCTECGSASDDVYPCDPTGQERIVCTGCYETLARRRA